HSSSKCSYKKWSEYVEMSQVRTNETPSKWIKWIWEHLTYFRKNDLLSIESKKYLEARKLIQLSNSSSYASEIGIAICFSCDQSHR
ncbi:18872_t:CDS:1, partial [Gigaspora margarita]